VELFVPLINDGTTMPNLDLLRAFALGIIEGLTEFLPVSSTGHLIAAGTFLNFDPPYAKAFDVVIQFGAILAVCWEFRVEIIDIVRELPSSGKARRFVINVAIATCPAVILALLFEKAIKAKLFSPLPVAIALIVGGILILLVERREKESSKERRITSLDAIGPVDALKIGFIQCLALIPGTSRSGATIIGGMIVGLKRQVATEFSFFLAIPIIFGATLYEMTKLSSSLTFEAVQAIFVGLVMAFISAFACVRWLLNYVSSHDFSIFGWYRIAAGALVLLWYGSGTH
jgi:undecaprenyl-diphosphatase